MNKTFSKGLMYSSLALAAVGIVNHQTKFKLDFSKHAKIWDQLQTRQDLILNNRLLFQQIISTQQVIEIPIKTQKVEILTVEQQPFVEQVIYSQPENIIQRPQFIQFTKIEPAYELSLPQGVPSLLKLLENVKDSQNQRHVQDFTMYSLAAYGMLHRLQDKINQARIDHKKETDFQLQQLEKERYPRPADLEHLNEKLQSYGYNLLPYGQPLLTSETAKGRTLNEIQQVVSKNRAYLVAQINELENAAKMIEQREVFHKLISQYDHQVLTIKQQASEKQQYLAGQIQDLQKFIENSGQYQAKKLNKTKELMAPKLQVKVLDEIINVQNQKYNQVATDVNDAVNKVLIARKNESVITDYIQRVRQLQGVIWHQLYSEKNVGSIKDAVKMLYLENDPVISSLEIDIEVDSFTNIQKCYPKDDILINRLVKNDSVQAYLFGKARFQYLKFVGFEDEVQTSLREGDLKKAVILARKAECKNSSLFQEWIERAEKRLAKEEALKVLEVYSNKLIQKVN